MYPEHVNLIIQKCMLPLTSSNACSFPNRVHDKSITSLNVASLIHHQRVSCTAPLGALCVEPTRFTRARHPSRSCARGSVAAGSRPSWSRSRLTTSIQRVRGAPRVRFQPDEPGSKSRIARERWCGGMRRQVTNGECGGMLPLLEIVKWFAN